MDRSIKLYFDDNTEIELSTTNIDNLNIQDYYTSIGTTNFEVIVEYTESPTSFILKNIYMDSIKDKKCIKAEYIVDGNVLDELIESENSSIKAFWKTWYGEPIRVIKDPKDTLDSVLNENITIKQFS